MLAATSQPILVTDSGAGQLLLLKYQLLLFKHQLLFFIVGVGGLEFSLLWSTAELYRAFGTHPHGPRGQSNFDWGILAMAMRPFTLHSCKLSAIKESSHTDALKETPPENAERFPCRVFKAPSKWLTQKAWFTKDKTHHRS